MDPDATITVGATVRYIADVFNHVHQAYGPSQDQALAEAADRIGRVLEAGGWCDYYAFADLASMSGLEIVPNDGKVE